MAATKRKPLVLVGNGYAELPAGDTLGINARFTGTASIPAILALGTGSVTFTVTPAIAGDSLAVGEPIDAYSVGADLPAGVILGQSRVTNTNQVKLTFLGVIAISVTSVNWTIVAHR